MARTAVGISRPRVWCYRASELEGFRWWEQPKEQPYRARKDSSGDIMSPRRCDSARLEGARGGGFDDGKTGCIWLQVYCQRRLHWALARATM